jgi:uncharacterized protein YecE (DUF72 family)
MIIWQTARHEVVIFGKAVDATTKKPVPGALVEIRSKAAAFEKKLQLAAMQYGDRWATMMERADRTITRRDGLFYFLDLPDGQYTLNVRHPSAGRRYGRVEQTVQLAHDTKKKRVRVEIALAPTTVKGRIVAPGQKVGVAMAEVRVKGSGERTFSDVQGQYLLTGLEPGKRTVTVLAQGYGAASQVVNVPEPGALETLNFNLVREGR